MNTILIGFKGSGKTAVGKILAEKTGKKFFDLDDTITELYEKEFHSALSSREIHKKHGANFFRALEAKAVEALAKKRGCIIALGGGTPVYCKNISLFKKKSRFFYLKDSPEKLLPRIKTSGVPAFLDTKDLEGSMRRELAKREPFYEKIADETIDCTKASLEEIAKEILKLIGDKKNV